MFSAKFFSVLALLLVLAPACGGKKNYTRCNNCGRTVVRTHRAPVVRKKVVRHRHERVFQEPRRVSGPDGWNVDVDEM